MKTTGRLIFLFGCVALSGQAVSAPQDISFQDRKNQSVRTLKCVRTFVEQRRGGAQGLATAAHVVERLYEAQGSLARINDTLDECATALRTTKAENISYDQVWETFDQMYAADAYSEPALRAVGNFIRQDVECSGLGAQVGAGFIWGASAEIGFRHCISSAGYHWIEVAPGLGAGDALGVTGMVHVMADTRTKKTQSWIDVSARDNYAIAFIVGTTTPGILKDAGHDNNTWTGAGIGVGGISVRQGNLNIRVIPLGTNNDRLYQMFEKNKFPVPGQAFVSVD